MEIDSEPAFEWYSRWAMQAAFSFAGQRCMAVRRVIVEHTIRRRFTTALVAAIAELTIGSPLESSTRIGPLVTREAQRRIAVTVAAAQAEGGRVLCGGQIPVGRELGCWYEPTLLSGLPQSSPVVQTESFGPLLVLSDAIDIDDAIHQLNAVEQGLTATLYCDVPELQQRFLEAVEVGIIWLQGRPPILDPQAPFGGWKESALGPPEHGEWDRAFYSRPQAVYGASEDIGSWIVRHSRHR